MVKSLVNHSAFLLDWLQVEDGYVQGMVPCIGNEKNWLYKLIGAYVCVSKSCSV
jgi:hypothetical protein